MSIDWKFQTYEQPPSSGAAVEASFGFLRLRPNFILAVFSVGLIAGCIGGCYEKREMGSPACAELKTTVDPAPPCANIT